MRLRFFADHCVSNFIVNAIKDSGYEVIRLRETIPLDSPDEVVISKAQELDAILLSLNGDFADIVIYPPSSFKGIIALQVRNHPEVIPQIISTLKDYLSAHSDMAHYAKKLLLVEVHRIRVRQ